MHAWLRTGSGKVSTPLVPPSAQHDLRAYTFRMTISEPLQPHRTPCDQITARQAHARQEAGATLVDVREDHERAVGMPADALALPLDRLQDEAANRLPDRGSEVMLLCASGQRSQRAAQLLAGMGYTRVSSVEGGFGRWAGEGLPITGGLVDADASDRYARQMRLPEVGASGQARLAAATVAIVGAGGLGSPVAMYLAGAGVGRLTIIDDDRVERSNLHRQVLHADTRVGQAKVASARLALEALNPRVRMDLHEGRLDASNVDAWLTGHDVIVDAADNFPTRYVLSAASLRLGLPLVYGAIDRFAGMASVFDPRDPESPCYRCLFPEPPDAADAPNCSEAGVLGVLPGLVGMIQATETLKLLLQIGQSLCGRLLRVDALSMRFHEVRLARHADCPGCGPDRAG